MAATKRCLRKAMYILYDSSNTIQE